MAEVQPLNRQPSGLLSLFDIRLGRYPEGLAQLVQPMIDLLEWTAVGNAADASADSNRSVVGLGGQSFANGTLSGLGGVVPANELWLVDRFSLLADMDADQSIRLAPALQFPSVGGFAIIFPLVESQSLSLPAGGGALRVGSERLFIAPPGSTLIMDVQQLTVGAQGNVPVFGTIRFLRLRNT